MEDDPIKAVMTKRKSSIVLACRAIKKGNAQGFFSAGSTGAVTAAATAYVTPFRYEEDGERRPVRPCITTAVPTPRTVSPSLRTWVRTPMWNPMTSSASPRWPLPTRAWSAASSIRAWPAFQRDRGAQGVALHAGVLPLMAERVPGFAGNCEGTDLLSGRLDVIVSDGFAGTSRSRRPRVRQSTLLGELKGALMGSIKGKIAALLVKDALYAIKDKLSGRCPRRGDPPRPQGRRPHRARGDIGGGRQERARLPPRVRCAPVWSMPWHPRSTVSSRKDAAHGGALRTGASPGAARARRFRPCPVVERGGASG